MKKILVSACLYGEACRYDGKVCPCEEETFLRWKAEGRLVPVCPERDGGLPIPRDPCEIRGGRVVTKDGKDRTAAYEKGARIALETAKENDIAFGVLKSKSPSCGTGRIYDGTFTRTLINGDGVAAAMLKDAGYAVYDETEIGQIEKAES